VIDNLGSPGTDVGRSVRRSRPSASGGDQRGPATQAGRRRGRDPRWPV